MEPAGGHTSALRQALRWFFGPRCPPSRRERLVLALGVIAGVVLIAVSDAHGWWNAIGVGFVGGCGGALIWSRGFRGASGT